MIPSVRKSATLQQDDTWRKDRRLRLHHACIAKVADMINKFGSEDKHLLCADGQVHTSTYQYILVCTSLYKNIPVYTGMYWYVPVHTCMYQHVLEYADLKFVQMDGGRAQKSNRDAEEA